MRLEVCRCAPNRPNRVDRVRVVVPLEHASSKEFSSLSHAKAPLSPYGLSNRGGLHTVQLLLYAYRSVVMVMLQHKAHALSNCTSRAPWFAVPENAVQLSPSGARQLGIVPPSVLICFKSGQLPCQHAPKATTATLYTNCTVVYRSVQVYQ